VIFHKRVGKAKFGVERLHAGNSFGVSDASHDSGVAAHPYFHVVILENLVLWILFLRFRKIVSARRDLSLGICQRVIVHHTLFDTGGITVLIAESEFTFRAQNVIFIASPEGNEREDEQ